MPAFRFRAVIAFAGLGAGAPIFLPGLLTFFAATTKRKHNQPSLSERLRSIPPWEAAIHPIHAPQAHGVTHQHPSKGEHVSTVVLIITVFGQEGWKTLSPKIQPQ